MRRLSAWIRALLRRGRLEKDLETELALHLALETRKNVTAGMSPDEARRRAHLAFDGLQRVKEECRDVSPLASLDALWKDVRYGVRSLRRAPGFTVAAIATIALGLGLNTAVFTIFNAYLLRPIEVRDPSTLHSITWTDRNGNGHRFSWEGWEALRRDTKAFSDVVALTSAVTRIADRPMFGHLVTGNHFGMLGVPMARGRPLLSEDTVRPGAAAVLVLSHRAWQAKFAGDPHIVGRRVMIRGLTMEVVGVAGAGFQGLGDVPVDFWAPLTLVRYFNDGPDLFGPARPEQLLLVGRLRPGISRPEAERDVLAWAQGATAHRPADERAVAGVVLAAGTRIALTRQVLTALAPILTSFGLVLLIACANVANMTLARTMARRRELGVRTALGASRAQVLRLLLVESVLLAPPATVAGLLLSVVVLRGGIALAFSGLPPEYAALMIDLAPPGPDLAVFAFMLIAAIASAAVFGLAPAVEGSRAGAVQSIRTQISVERAPTRLRNALVVLQIAASALLLTSAGVLLRGGRSLERLDPGIDPQRIIALDTTAGRDPRLLNHLASDPRVDGMAGTTDLPLDGSLPHAPVRLPGIAGAANVGYTTVSPEFFSLMGVPILEGRGFRADEATPAAAVAIISRGGAARLWPQASAVGQTIAIGLGGVDGQPLAFRTVRIVGVAADITHGWLGFGNDASCLYLPEAMTATRGLMLRVRGDAGTVRRDLQRELDERFPRSVSAVSLLTNVVRAQVFPLRTGYGVALALGATALLLTLAGVYGVLSYLVAQRTREIGIRIALGAARLSVIGLVLRDMTRQIGWGVSIGLIAAVGAARLLASVITIVDVYDAAAFCGGAAAVTVAATFAAYLPARRASRLNPVVALRLD